MPTFLVSPQLRRSARPTVNAVRPFATKGQYEIIDHQYDVCVVGAGGENSIPGV